jgi:hypothetical protein
VPKRSPDDQVGKITGTGSQATATVLSQIASSHFHAKLGLTLVGEQWRVSYLRNGSTVFSPPGLVSNALARKLWVRTTCRGTHRS